MDLLNVFLLSSIFNVFWVFLALNTKQKSRSQENPVLYIYVSRDEEVYIFNKTLLLFSQCLIGTVFLWEKRKYCSVTAKFFSFLAIQVQSLSGLSWYHQCHYSSTLCSDGETWITNLVSWPSCCQALFHHRPKDLFPPYQLYSWSAFQ